MNLFRLPLLLALAVLLAVTAAAETNPLAVEHLTGSRLRLAWSNGPAVWVAETTSGVAPENWQPVLTPLTSVGDQRSFEVEAGSALRFFRLRKLAPARVSEVSPLANESGVSVNREVILQISAPLAADTVLTTEQFFATAAGRKLLGRVEVGADRRTVTLFALEPVPAGTKVAVTFNPTGVHDINGLVLDANGDGLPGGTLAYTYSTHSVAVVAKTAVAGQVFASEPVHLADGTVTNHPLAGVTVTVDGAEESLRAVTGADGKFRLDPAPAGRVFVHVDGRTATESHWPDGAYYPFVGKAWEIAAGKDNNLVNGSGKIFLPRVPAGALQTVFSSAPTVIHLVPELVGGDPRLAGVEITVPANALFDDNGTRGGRIGLAIVPPDRLPEPLPVGLRLPLVATLQSSGPMNFAAPVTVKFPNLPDPLTGAKLVPGAKTTLWSFNHDLGHWAGQGPMTVTPDGDFVVSDPGYGLRQPGWFGTGGASGVAPGPASPPPKPPCTTPGADLAGIELNLEPCLADLLGAGDAMKALTDARSGVNDLVAASNLANQAAQEGRPILFIKAILAENKASAELLKSGLDAANALNPAQDAVDAVGCVIAVAQAGAALACSAQCELDFGTHSCDDLNDIIAAAIDIKTIAGELVSGNLATDSLIAWLDLLTKICNKLALPPTVASFGRDPRPAGATPELLAEFDQATANLIQDLQALDATLARYQVLLEKIEVLVPIIQTDVSSDFIALGGFANGAATLEGGGQFNRIAIGVEGVITLPVLQADTVYRLAVIGRLLRSAGFVSGEATFRSAPAGLPTPFPVLKLMQVPRNGPDADADGLPDFAEAIYGSDPHNPDTDNDGDPDGTDLEPLVPHRLQVISHTLTPATPGAESDAEQCVAEGNHVYVAAGDAGLLIYEWNPAGTLTPVGNLAFGPRGGFLNSFATKIAVEDSIAIVMASQAFWIIDVADPSAPRILHTQSVMAGFIQDVTVRNGLAYVIFDSLFANIPDELWVFEAATGAQILDWKSEGQVYEYQNNPNCLPGDPACLVTQYPDLIGVRADGGHVYLLETRQVPQDPFEYAGALHFFRESHVRVLSPVAAGLTQVGSLPLPQLVYSQDLGTGLELAGNRLYLDGYYGWRALDISNPAHPTLLATPPAIQSNVRSLAPDGNHSLLTITSYGGKFTQAVTLYDTTDPTDPNQFVETLNKDGAETAVTIHDGYALVATLTTALANGSRFPGGVYVMRFTDRDMAGLAPTAAILQPVGDLKGGAVHEIQVTATDDILVRHVELLADGVVVATDYNYPFAPRWKVPPQVSAHTVTLQARATDTGGNQALSAPVIVRVTP